MFHLNTLFSKYLPLSALIIGLSFSVHAQAQEHDEAAHKAQDIATHRAIANAHETAAKCLESGKKEDVCHANLQKACKGLALGKYCGMKHE